ncbi:Homeobox protein HD-9 [Grifola frondosa]|uniref:Homeobox protein HD-9 n=1 Tax=Grifola frondosa TaxID=5627 RepID=A0A1C7MWS1_GRIFR|nr:Homeobox protein HD-9 [Grifola frondosa]
MSPILRPSSVSSSSSSNSSSISTKPRKPPHIPFARRRLTAAQTDALVTVFQVKTHPSREERAVLAADLTMEMKAVNAWFQNKRRSLKKQSSMWTRASLPENRHVKPSPSSNPRTVTSQGFGISLDFIAASHELPYKEHHPRRYGGPLGAYSFVSSCGAIFACSGERPIICASRSFKDHAIVGVGVR